MVGLAGAVVVHGWGTWLVVSRVVVRLGSRVYSHRPGGWCLSGTPAPFFFAESGVRQ